MGEGLGVFSDSSTGSLEAHGHVVYFLAPSGYSIDE